MENLLQGIPHVSVYIDDVLGTGWNDSEHLQNLCEVLRHMEMSVCASRKINTLSCDLRLSILDHTISSHVVQLTQDKVEAIQNSPTPTNVHQLNLFLWLPNLYTKFLPNSATKLAPLCSLLQKDQPWGWVWGSHPHRTFTAAKSLLILSAVLVHYCDQKELTLACDASSSGLGAVLSDREADGSEKPDHLCLSYSGTSWALLQPVGQRSSCHCLFAGTKFHRYLLVSTSPFFDTTILSSTCLGNIMRFLCGFVTYPKLGIEFSCRQLFHSL